MISLGYKIFSFLNEQLPYVHIAPLVRGESYTCRICTTGRIEVDWDKSFPIHCACDYCHRVYRIEEGKAQ